MKRIFAWGVLGCALWTFSAHGQTDSSQASNLVRLENNLSTSAPKNLTEADLSKSLQKLKAELKKNAALAVKLEAKLKKEQASVENAQNKVQGWQEKKKTLEDAIGKNVEASEPLKKELASPEVSSTPSLLKQKTSELKTLEAQIASDVKARKKLEAPAQKTLKKYQSKLYEFSRHKERLDHARSEEARIKAEIAETEKQLSELRGQKEYKP